MENCSEKKECGGRREFLVKAGAIAGGVMLSLSGAAGVAKAADDEELVIKVDMNGDLIKKGSQTFETKAGKIIVIHGESGFTAFEAKCTHKGGPLKYDAATKTLSCPWHGSTFDGATGAATKGPATTALVAHSADAAVVIGAKPKA